jgi:hydrogenase expression/formation protein HypE
MGAATDTLTGFTARSTPVAASDRIVLGHGTGGRLARELVARVFGAAFAGPIAPRDSAAVVAISGPGRVALASGVFVVEPVGFAGGDVGALALCGTINDLAAAGADPRCLTATFVLEEGLPISVLERIVASMRAVSVDTGVPLVTGDLRVVERGKCDRVAITTSGVGVVPDHRRLGPAEIRPGDAVVLSGTIAEHGAAVISARLGIVTGVASDCAPVTGLVRGLSAAVPDARCLRGPTHGGLSAALTAIAEAAGVGIRVRETAIPVKPAVRAACELLDLDPLCVPAAGKVVAIVPAARADRAVAALREHPLGRDAVVIGEVTTQHPGVVVIAGAGGAARAAPMLAGDQLNRVY